MVPLRFTTDDRVPVRSDVCCVADPEAALRSRRGGRMNRRNEAEAGVEHAVNIRGREAWTRISHLD
jgi:hypothetical protein